MAITKHVDLTGLGHFRDKILVSEITNTNLYKVASGSPNPSWIYYHLENGEYIKVLDRSTLPSDLTGKSYYTAVEGSTVDEQHAPSVKAVNEFVPEAVSEHIELYVRPAIDDKVSKIIQGGTLVTTVAATLNPASPSATEIPTSKAIVDALNPVLAAQNTRIEKNATDISSIKTTLTSKVDKSSVGEANGVAGLDSTGKVPSSQLPENIGITYTLTQDTRDAHKLTFTSSDTSVPPTVITTADTTYEAVTSSKDGLMTSTMLGDLNTVKNPDGNYYNVQANWNESDGNSWSYIQNKPTALPNPSALTINLNGTETVYTGSAARNVSITKTTIGLGNVDNTSDANKPVSTATQTALDKKADTVHTHTKSQITDFPTLGTAAAKDVPSSGNASTTQVVMGNDSRLTDARTPKSHTHSASDVTGLATVATSGNYEDLTNKPTIPTAGSITSGSTGYATGDAVYTALAGKADTSHTQAASTITGLADVATSGSYEDLTNKPTIPAAGTTASAVSTTASGGSATTYSKSDHVHSITLATGDSNGQVKIAGTNVSVKGLGSAAYTASTAYATATQGTKADNALPKSDVVDGLTTASATKALSANQGVELDKRIKNLEALGRYLSEWDCTTGTAMTEPLYYPYPYKAGDYFLVLAVGSTNYKPTGVEYTQGYKSTTVETKTVQQGDRYIFDGSVWILQSNAQQTVSFANIAGNATDNTSLAAALNGKADTSHTQAASTITGLADVATSGSYNDLSNKPTIPSKTSQLTNDSGFTTNVGTITGIKMNGVSKGTSGEVDLGTVLTEHQSLAGYVPTSRTVNSKSLTGNINLTYSDVGAAAESHTQAYTTLTGSTETENQAIVSNGTVNGWMLKTLGSNAFTSTTIPSRTSQLTNDSGFLTEHQSLAGYVPTSRTINGNALTGNINLTYSDVGAAAESHTQASNTITAMTGYSKATVEAAISPTDSLNTAIGKLEYKIEQSSGGGSADIRQTVNNFLQLNTFSASLSVTAASTEGTITIPNGGIVAASGIKGSKVYNAVWMDLVDCIEVSDDTDLEFGRCYCFDGKKYQKTSKYMEDCIIGVHSDTAGMIIGTKKGKNLQCAVAGFVLAYVDKEYKPGTALTCGENGCLTEMKPEDKVMNPEKIVAIYWKDELNEEWGSDNEKVKVNGRKWVKVR